MRRANMAPSRCRWLCWPFCKKYVKPHVDEIEIPTACWTEQVPELVLYIVCRKLGAIKDLLAFGSVCRLWNRVFKDWRRQIAASMPPVLFMADKGSFYDLTAPCGGSSITSQLYQEIQDLQIAPPLSIANLEHYVFFNPFNKNHKCGSGAFCTKLFNDKGGHDKAAAFLWASITSNPSSPAWVICAVGPGRRIIRHYLYEHRFTRPYDTYLLPGSGCPLSVAVFQEKLFVLTDELNLVCIDLLLPQPQHLVSEFEGVDHSLRNRRRYLVADPDGGDDGRGQLLLVENEAPLPCYLFTVMPIVGSSNPTPPRLEEIGGGTIFLDKWSGIIWRPPTTPTHVTEEGGSSAGGGISSSDDDDGSAKPLNLRDCIIFINSHGVLCAFRMKDGTVEELSYSIPENETSYSWVVPGLCY